MMKDCSFSFTWCYLPWPRRWSVGCGVCASITILYRCPLHGTPGFLHSHRVCDEFSESYISSDVSCYIPFLTRSRVTPGGVRDPGGRPRQLDQNGCVKTSERSSYVKTVAMSPTRIFPPPPCLLSCSSPNPVLTFVLTAGVSATERPPERGHRRTGAISWYKGQH